jgi:hypothetical protein
MLRTQERHAGGGRVDDGSPLGKEKDLRTHEWFLGNQTLQEGGSGWRLRKSKDPHTPDMDMSTPPKKKMKRLCLSLGTVVGRKDTGWLAEVNLPLVAYDACTGDPNRLAAMFTRALEKQTKQERRNVMQNHPTRCVPSL